MLGYEVLKMVHIFSVCLMVGATAINGLLHGSVLRSPQTGNAVSVLGSIMRVNRWIMAPSFAGIILSAAGLVYETGYDPFDLWLAVSIVLTLLLVVAFIGGYVLERHLEAIACDAKRRNAEKLPPLYRKIFSRAAPIGAGAMVTSIAVIYLMVAKPV